MSGPVVLIPVCTAQPPVRASKRPAGEAAPQTKHVRISGSGAQNQDVIFKAPDNSNVRPRFRTPGPDPSSDGTCPGL